MLKSFGAAAAAISLVVASAPASASCWSREEASAATVRDLQSLLMVATLRCRAAGLDITADYNGFVSANRILVQHENERIKAHFIRSQGPVAGQRAYDSFATHLANIYGGGDSSPAACNGMASLAREGALMADSEEGLLLLAARQGISTELPDSFCERPVMAYGEGAPVTARADVQAPAPYAQASYAPAPYGAYAYPR